MVDPNGTRRSVGDHHVRFGEGGPQSTLFRQSGGSCSPSRRSRGGWDTGPIAVTRASAGCYLPARRVRWRSQLANHASSRAGCPFAKGVLPLRPGAPGGDLDGDHRTWRRLPHVLLVLGAKVIKCPLAPATRFDHLGAPIDTDPPQGRPVLAVVVDQQRHRRGHPHVLEPAQRQGRLGFSVDRRVDELTLNSEATWHDVRPSVRTDGGQAPYASFMDAAPHRRDVHLEGYSSSGKSADLLMSAHFSAS